MNPTEYIAQWLHLAYCPDGERQAQQHFGQLLASLFVMAWFVEARDPYTGGHLWRVSRYARLLAEAAGLDHAEAARISLGGFLHDLGKIGVPDAILRKTGRLSDEEYAVIKTHPDLGKRMLAGHPLAELVRHALHSHHERPDGTGYPRGLRDDMIPLEARIVSICDAFDAMTSSRPYRTGMPREKALAIIGDNLGLQFDRRYGAQFIALGHAGHLDHIQGHSDDGIPLQSCPMCGPTLVLRREQQAGEHIFCRNCSGEFSLEESAGGLVVAPTGRVGSAEDLEPVADEALIARVVEASIQAMDIPALLQPPLQSLPMSGGGV